MKYLYVSIAVFEDILWSSISFIRVFFKHETLVEFGPNFCLRLTHLCCSRL